MQMYPGWSARDNYGLHSKKKRKLRGNRYPLCDVLIVNIDGMAWGLERGWALAFPLSFGLLDNCQNMFFFRIYW